MTCSRRLRCPLRRFREDMSDGSLHIQGPWLRRRQPHLPIAVSSGIQT